MTDAAPLETIVEDGVRAFGVPGLAVAVTDREQTLWTDLRGRADIAAGRPVRPATLFQIA